MLMGRRIFEHIYECPEIRPNVLFGSPQENCGIHTGVQCPVKYSLSQPVWSLFFVSRVALGIHCWKPHRYLKELCGFCFVSCQPEILQLVSREKVTWRAEVYGLSLPFLLIIFLLLNAYKKPKPAIKSLIRSQLLVSVDMQKWLSMSCKLCSFGSFSFSCENCKVYSPRRCSDLPPPPLITKQTRCSCCFFGGYMFRGNNIFSCINYRGTLSKN